MNSVYKKRFWRSLIILGSLITLLGVLLLLRLSTDICEWWSRTISRGFYYVFAPITKYIPFSLTEIFIIVAILGVGTWLFFVIRHLHRLSFRGSSHLWLKAGIIITAFLLTYVGTAGMEYNRYPVDIPQYEGEPIEDGQVLYDMIKYYHDEYNACANVLGFNEETGEVNRPYTIDQLNKIISDEYAKLESDYFTKFTTNSKPMYLFNWLYREFQITGYSFAPLGEASINNLCTNSELPFTIAHEIAHSKGVMKEDEANLVAAYICLNSSDAYLKYSGLCRTYSSVLPFAKASNIEGAVLEITKTLDSRISEDRHYTYSYWEEHDFLSKASNFFNNLYLEIFGNENTDYYIDHTQTIVIDNDDGTKTYRISLYSPYQKMCIALYQKMQSSK